MQIDAAENLLKQRFSNVQRAGDILRADYRLRDKKVASYWFDFSDEIPRTADKLQRYADKVVGPSYFSDAESPDMRWNFYLYFVTGAKTAGLKAAEKASLKGMIESDRNFARKFVVEEGQIESVVTSIGVVPTAKAPAKAITNVAEVWRSELEKEGLEFLLDHSTPLTEKMRQVAQAPTKNIKRREPVKTSKQANNLSASTLTDLDLSEFRTCPQRKMFESLGKANLVFGPNGVGKTTFLEAIEYFYCGGTLRNPSVNRYSVTAGVKGHGKIKTPANMTLDEARGRLSAWYGLNDKSRQNPLPGAFARFNYMNVDAAAKLMLRGAEHEELIESLKQLLGGEEAASMETLLTRVRDQLAGESSRKHSNVELVKAQLAGDKTELEGLAKRPTEVDADLAILWMSLSELRWTGSDQDKSAVTPELINELANANSLIDRAISSEPGPAERTIKNLIDFRSQLKLDHLAVETHLRKLDSIRDKRSQWMAARLDAERSSERLSLWTAERATEVLVSSRRMEVVNNGIQTLSPLLSGYSIGLSEADVAPYMEIAVGEALNRLRKEIEVGREQVAIGEQSLEDARARQGTINSQVAQLVVAARKLIEHAKDPDDCPLCAHHHEAGELGARISSLEMSLDDNDHLELEKRLADQRENVELSSALLAKLESLSDFVRNASGGEATVGEAYTLHVRMILESTRLMAERQRLTEQVGRFNAAGFTVADLLQVLGAESLPEVVEQDVFTTLRANLTGVMAEMDVQLGVVELDATKVREEIDAILSKYSLVEADYADNVSLLESSIHAIDDLLGELKRGGITANLDSNKSLTSIQSQTKTALLQAMRVAEAAKANAAASERQTELLKSVAYREEARKEAELVAKRFVSAHGVVDRLLSGNSLASATEEAMRTVHQVADGVFARIHTPSEYRINDSLASPLCKKDADEPVALTEVSSGQRAAYALSLFIAMNAEAKKAPRVMLLDDPIAHIDDLNALSFLDYLRDMVVEDERQIFFATADDKLAGLFAHKFGFLGDDFRIIELTR